MYFLVGKEPKLNLKLLFKQLQREETIWTARQLVLLEASIVNILTVVVLQRDSDTTLMKASKTLHQGRDMIVKAILIIPQDLDDAMIQIIRLQEETFKMTPIIHPLGTEGQTIHLKEELTEMILIIHLLGIEDKIIRLQEEVIEMILIIHLQDFTNWIIIVLK